MEIQNDVINDNLATHLFSTKFKVIGDTELIYEQAKDNSTSFDELLNILRTKLAERDFLREQDSNKNAHSSKGYMVAQNETPTITPTHMINNTYTEDFRAAQVFLDTMKQHESD